MDRRAALICALSLWRLLSCNARTDRTGKTCAADGMSGRRCLCPRNQPSQRFMRPHPQATSRAYAAAGLSRGRSDLRHAEAKPGVRPASLSVRARCAAVPDQRDSKRWSPRGARRGRIPLRVAHAGGTKPGVCARTVALMSSVTRRPSCLRPRKMHRRVGSPSPLRAGMVLS